MAQARSRVRVTMSTMTRVAVLLVLASLWASVGGGPALAAPKPLVAVLPPATDNAVIGDLALLMQARATQLLLGTGQYQELHLKQIARAAPARLSSLSKSADALLVAHRLGAARVVFSSLAPSPKGLELVASLVGVAGKRAPATLTVTLSAAPAKAVEEGGRALAGLVAVADQVKLDGPPPLSNADEAVSEYARCYGVLIRQPITIDSPTVLAEEELQTAIKSCRRAVAVDPKLDAAWSALGLALAIDGKDAEAVRALVRVDVGNSSRYLPLYWVGRYWLTTRYRSADEGATVLQKALEKHPGFLLARGYLGEHLGAVGQHDKALDLWRAYLVDVPGNGYVRGRVSHALARLGRDAEALVAAEEQRKLDPDDPDGQLTVASRYIDAKRLADAVAVLEPLAKDPGARAELLLRLGWAYQLQNKLEAAEPLYREAEHRATPTEWRTKARARLDRARLMRARGDQDGANQLMREGVRDGYRDFFASQTDAEAKALLREAEKKPSGPTSVVEKFKARQVRDASPFQFSAGGEINPQSGEQRRPAPQNFELFHW